MNTNTSVRILVVEDDEAIRATMLDILELNGYATMHADNGLDGLALARRHHPDVVMTDVKMPGMTGFELVKALHNDEQTRAIPVIIVSASVEPEQMRMGMDLGAEDFIVKPFTEAQVTRSIEARLEKKALLDELDAFAHTVAHDLKNPIAVLMGRAGLLKMMWKKADEETMLKSIDALESSAVRLNTIVDELLLLAGVRRQAVHPQVIDMEAIVNEALSRVENLVQQAKAQIERPRQWPAVLAHGPWVAEVWANYLSNALKYGGTPPQLQLGAEAVPARGCVRFWVQDNGPGLTPEQQGQLFQQFSRVTQTRVKGHGLGLSIVLRITEKLGGTAGVESQPGAGSRFWFELPAAPAGAAP
ncbi:MAG TPA: hybrid sensor histidine kinase/response regulator [Lacunisphaera sp.]|nr:hybrid sensor histidine kinase/response regulator [Lacunisphaera sp.]